MIIGLLGFKHVGKSTAAKHLIKNHGFILHNMKGAIISEMKENLGDLLNEIVRHLEIKRGSFEIEPWTIDRLFDEKPPLMRALMVDYGMMRRKDNEDYWVKQWLSGYAITKGPVVVDDVRFKNEARAIRDMNGILIRLNRSDVTTGGDSISETEHLDIQEHYTINAGPGEEEYVYKVLDQIMSEVLK